VVVDVPVTREDAIPFSGSSSYYAAVAVTADSVVEIMAVVAVMTVCGSSCFSSAAADVVEMAEDASASLSIHSIQAAGIAGRPVSFYCLYQKRLCPLQARRFLPSGQDSFLIHRSSIL
jgi:hypothetical protein